MTLEHLALTVTDDLPIKHEGKVHSGKVRSVYWLTEEDSARIGSEHDLVDQQLGVMIISDRISAFECMWETKGGLKGIPGKGAALNAISNHWFQEFDKAGLAGNHIVESPHPLVWIVKRAQPIMIEAIARQYITGSMWRNYEKGEREFGGVILPNGLTKNQRLDHLLITPSTKGIMRGIPGIPEQDDTNITRQQILDNYEAFKFRHPNDVDKYETLLTEGFGLIYRALERIGEIFVDTKFEFGYVARPNGTHEMIYMDEVGTPDSSRYWSQESYDSSKPREDSKERFREMLLSAVPDPDVLTNKGRFGERLRLARSFKLEDDDFMEIGRLYTELAQEITGREMPLMDDAKEGILDSLSKYDIVK